MSNNPAASSSQQSLNNLRYRPNLGTVPITQQAPQAPAAEANAALNLLREAVQQNSTWVGPLQQEMSRVIVGQKLLLDRLLVALLTNGHVLLEGVPGLAKTLSLKTLANSIALQFKRLQFTPDMLPADIVGTMIYNPQAGDFHTRHGPIFSNLILADEINRAPAKVQSALLEAMQEHQVTIGDATYPLPNPFMVLATTEPPVSVRQVVSEGQILRAREVVNSIYVDDKVKDYIVDLVLATRPPTAAALNLNGYIQTGASPRATINLTLAARATAFLNGRHYVTPQDVKTIALDVLRHRVTVSYEAEAENVSSEDIIRKILDTLPVP